jgi:hypothetical protein
LPRIITHSHVFNPEGGALASVKDRSGQFLGALFSASGYGVDLCSGCLRHHVYTKLAIHQGGNFSPNISENFASSAPEPAKHFFPFQFRRLFNFERCVVLRHPGRWRRCTRRSQGGMRTRVGTRTPMPALHPSVEGCSANALWDSDTLARDRPPLAVEKKRQVLSPAGRSTCGHPAAASTVTGRAQYLRSSDDGQALSQYLRTTTSLCTPIGTTRTFHFLAVGLSAALCKCPAMHPSVRG